MSDTDVIIFRNNDGSWDMNYRLTRYLIAVKDGMIVHKKYGTVWKMLKKYPKDAKIYEVTEHHFNIIKVGDKF